MSNTENSLPQAGAIRRGLREIVKDRTVQRLHAATEPSFPLSESPHLDTTGFSEPALCRLDRYAEVTEQQLGFPYVFEGDGTSARFKNFHSVIPDPGETPYRTFRRSIQDTFRRGWARFEEDIEFEHPGKLTEIRNRYDELLDKDPTSQQTGNRIDSEYLRLGVELGTEMAYFAFALGSAIHNSKDDVLSLEMATKTQEQRLDLALSLWRTPRARAIANLTHTFWTKRRACTFADWDKLRLLETPKNTYIFNQRGGQFAAYNPETDPPLADPTIGCMALLFKIKESDTYGALENAIFAAIHEAGEMDLFNPALAKAAEEQRRIIFAYPHMAQTIDALPEDLTKWHSDTRFEQLKGLYSTLESEFI